MGVGCSGPVQPSSTSLESPAGPSSSVVSASRSPAAQPPPATPASSWTITAGGGAVVYHYQPTSVVVPANLPIVVRFADGDVLDHTWTVFDTDGTTVLANLAVAKEGDVATGTFTFPTPGTYTFWCTIPGHKGFGEVGTLTVVP
jgi:plastocyanin